MQLTKTFLLVTGFFFFGINFSSCQVNPGAKQQSPGGTLTVEEFEQKLNSTKDAQVIDVRTPEEFNKGYIKGAKNIDWNGADFDSKANKLDKNNAVFVYCLAGGRSASASEKLRELGFKEIYELQGGMMAWNGAGKPVLYPGKENAGMSLEEYNKKLNSDKLVLVDFSAPWCKPCKKMAPMLEELAKEQEARLILVKIDADDNKLVTKNLHITVLPSLILYKNQKIVWQSTGQKEKADLLQVIQQNSK